MGIVLYSKLFFHIFAFSLFSKASSLSGQKDSIYSLAMNDAGTVLVSGSTEKVMSNLVDLGNQHY
jgi:hypothetical protein